MESFEITLRVVSRALFPASKQDADPLKSDRANGGVMALTVKALLCTMSLGPGQERMEWPANSWKDWRRNFGHAQRI